MTAWNDKVAWDWTKDGVPPGLSSEDQSSYLTYKIVQHIQYIFTVTVDRESITPELCQYYSDKGFFKEDIKARVISGVFETLSVPAGAYLYNTKGLVVPYGNDSTVTLGLTLDYIGPMHVHSTAIIAGTEMVSVVDVTQFAWAGTKTDGLVVDSFNYNGGTWKLGSVVYTIPDGSIAMPISTGTYTVVLYISTSTNAVVAAAATTFPAGCIPLYKITMDGATTPARIVQVKNYRSWAGAILHDTLPDAQGGTIGERYHLTLTQHAAATRIATSDLDGLLSHTDRAAFAGKQNAITTGTAAQYLRGDLSLGTMTGTITVLADVTLTAADVPAYAASANIDTDVVTITGHNPANGETYYIEGATPPTITGGNYRFVNEWVGPVVYTINASGATCKLSATKGGAALDITNAGNEWTLRRAGLNKVQIAGLSESTVGKKYEFISIAPNGNGWDTVNAVAMRATVNNQSTASYRNITSEGYSIIGNSNLGNVQGFTRITLDHCGTYLFGDYLQYGITGTDLAFANSVSKGSANPSACSYTLGTPITITSFEFFDPNNTDFYTIKVGTRFIVRRIG